MSSRRSWLRMRHPKSNRELSSQSDGVTPSFSRGKVKRKMCEREDQDDFENERHQNNKNFIEKALWKVVAIVQRK